MSLPHRSEVEAILRNSDRPLHVSEVATRLKVDVTRTPALTAMLDDMALFGPIRALPGNRYVSTEGRAKGTPAAQEDAPIDAKIEAREESKAAVRKVLTRRERQGTFTMNPRGFGFVASGVAGEQDVFITGDKMGGALHGDVVVVRLGRGGPRGPEGEIVSIVTRRATRVPGTLRRRGESTWLEPDDARMRGPIVLTNAIGADGVEGKEGDAIVAKIARYPEIADEHARGELLAVLGRPGDPKVEVAKILAREEILEQHPAAAVAEAESFGQKITAAQIEGREDLRDLPLCTIDPVDARDHDDAVFVRRATREDGENAAYVAWIAIADVASYVTPGTALDEDAKRRGCSVYLPDRAIPMLPRALSTHLCSLIENEDRLTLAVMVVMDATATPIRHRLVRGVMRSRAKLSYEDVARALGFSTDEAPSAKALGQLDALKVAWEVSSLLRARRMRRGALDFDLPEAKVKLDAEGQCIDVVRSRADPGVRKAYSLIEELMLLGNETVAESLVARGVATIFRVHGPPDELKLDKFAAMAETLGVPFKLDDAREPKALGKLLRSFATHPQAQILNSLLLRAMKQATYDTINIGHFGLASSAYLHFTSPIRRYPDLVVHRAVHLICEGKRVPGDDKALEALGQAAMLASAAERRAMEVEREVVDLHRCLLMKKHIGELYEGTVTALVGSGLFVALDSPYVDVLVKLESLGSDPFQLDDDGLRVTARRSGETITLGDRMIVQIEEAQIERRTVLARRLRSVASKHEDDANDDRHDGRAPPRRMKSKVAAKSSTDARTGSRDPTGKKRAAGKAKALSRHAAKDPRGRPRDEAATPAKTGAKKKNKSRR